MNTTGNDPQVRTSRAASNIFFVSPEPGSTLQSIGLQQWTMPWLSEGVPLYSILRVLGRGSYSCVCLAVDNRLASGGHRNPLVALKRVPNVLADHRQAKLVLREIAVLRRIRHPNVLQLRSAFLQPSSVGECRLIGGKLVHTAVDLYIATEFAEGGDLYSMRGNLTDRQVGRIMWDMLDGIRYLHSCGIWHRDVKSQNAFLFRGDTGQHREQGGLMWRVKLGDFGSSVWRGGEHGALGGGLSVDVSSEDEDEYDGCGDEFGDECGDECGEANGGDGLTASNGHHHGQMLTRQVCTPCYRAPEVVMSRGKYTDAVDMWGLGCIFGELLSRVSYVGSTSNSKLRVAPLFAVRDFPSVTPMPGEAFTNTKKELDALFKVIGTPSWRDIERVGMVEWRTYLGTLPGRAPTVMRRFKHAGEVAIHLLTRLLEFDPERRLTCDEAMGHEYFAELREDAVDDDRVVDVDVVEEMSVEGLSPAVARQLSVQENIRETPGSAEISGSSGLSARTASSPRDEDGLTIAQALAKLERELDEILRDDGAPENGRAATEHRQDFFSAKTQRLLAMLTKECEAVTSSLHPPPDVADEVNERKDKGTCHVLRNSRDRTKDNKGKGSRTSLVEDVVMDDSEYARGRMSNVRDTWVGNELDASKFLKANRHGEWSAERAGDGRRAAPSQGWGVSVEAPHDKGYAAAIRQQQMK